jgi:large subunit ribosomal protein L29
MKAKEVHEMTDEELEDKLGDIRKELFEMRFQAATGGLEDHSRMTHAKRDIARVLTVQRQRAQEKS